MEDEKKLYFVGLQTELSDIKFNQLDKPIEKINDIGVSTRDSYEIIDVRSDEFIIKCSRFIEFNPNMFFNLNVSFDVRLTLDKKSIKEYENRIEDLKKTIELKIEKILAISGVYARISTLISSITMQYNSNPIVTVPNYVK